MFGGKCLFVAYATALSISAATILLSSPKAKADYVNRNTAVTYSEAFDLNVLNPWSKKTKAEFYDSSPTTLFQKALDFINTESPAVILFEGKSRIQNPWPSATSKQIVKFCLKRTNTDMGVATSEGIMSLLSCISSSVFTTAADFYNSGVTESGCVTHALGMVDVIKRLGLRNIWADFYANSFGDGTFHVTNRITLRGTDHNMYTYVHDNSSDPSAMFPTGYYASKYHDQNGDGITDVTRLPDIALYME